MGKNEWDTGFLDQMKWDVQRQIVNFAIRIVLIHSHLASVSRVMKDNQTYLMGPSFFSKCLKSQLKYYLKTHK